MDNLFDEKLFEKGLDEIKGKIADAMLRLAKENIPNKDKKAKIDNSIVKIIMKWVKKIDFPGPDKAWDMAIQSALKTVVSRITQAIYQSIKDKIQQAESE